MSKIINFKQLFEIIKTHFVVSVIAFFVGTTLAPMIATKGAKNIFSLIFILFYMVLIYNKSEGIARRDKKGYTEEKPYKWKGLLLPIGVYIIWAFFYVLYFVSWKYQIISYTSGFLNNLLYLIWNYCFYTFINVGSGNVGALSIIMFFTVPLIACFMGYFAGYRNFDLSEKVAGMVYDKKDEDGKDGK